jgi:pyrroline-5-carboxylate reductase
MQITFIGGGNMAAAIIAGLVKEAGHTIRVVDRNADKCANLRKDYAVDARSDLPASFSSGDIVVLAVKPQQLKALCLELAPRLAGAMVVSIAAGIRIEALSRWLGSERIVRVMPNTPSMVGKGMSGLYADAHVSETDRHAAQSIMLAVGKVHWLPTESGIDNITCISGSGPAYVFYFLESMMQAARDVGFSDADARELALTTFEGAIELARQSPLDVSELRANVTSKGGTTARAIARFDLEGVKPAIIAGALDCRAHSITMGQQLSQD